MAGCEEGKCSEVIKKISSYLDGELDPGLKLDLESHLCSCHHCQVVFDTTRKTIELYCDGKLFALPTGVRTRLHEALHRKWQAQTR